MNVPIPMPRLTRIPMTVRFVMTGLTLATKEVKVTAPLAPLCLLICSALELGGLGGSDTVAEAQARTKPTKLDSGWTKMLTKLHESSINKNEMMG